MQRGRQVEIAIGAGTGLRRRDKFVGGGQLLGVETDGHDGQLLLALPVRYARRGACALTDVKRGKDGSGC